MDSIDSAEETAGGPVPEESSEFARMLDATLDPGKASDLAPGQKVKGKIVQIGTEEAFVDFGGRSEGVLSLSELRDEHGALKLGVGDSLEAVVSSVEGQITLTLALRQERPEAGALRRAHEAGLPVEGHVKAVNAGGFEVRALGTRAFCPFSQMDLHPVGDGKDWVGKTLSFRILEIKDGGRGVVLSRRALLQEAREQLGAELRQNLAAGQELDGTVTRIAPFGAFVDLGGVEGLVHVSELRRERVEDPAQAVKPGQKVRVKILRIQELGTSKERISLSMKALEADPWLQVAGSLREGDVVQGRVVRLADFGAFVEVLPGVDGLIHVSQASRRRVAHVRDVFTVGQEVAVKILKIDGAAKRLSLSAREVEPAVEGPSVAVGQLLEGVVAGVKPYGVFVDLPSGQTGLLPKAETEIPRGADPGKFFKPGDRLRVAVLEIAEDGKIRLSTKAAAEKEEAETARQYLAPPRKAEAPAPAPAPAGAFAEAMRRAEEKRQGR